MLFYYTALGTILAITSLAGAYQVIPTIEDGIPDQLNITTGPFVKIGHGYYYIETRTEKSWFDAFESCRRISAHLIAFETIEEWDFINQYLYTNGIDDLYWTSGADLAQKGKHDWFSTGEPISLDIWAPGEPNNGGGVEHCDELGYKATPTNYNGLNDKPCEVKRKIVSKNSLICYLGINNTKYYKKKNNIH